MPAFTKFDPWATLENQGHAPAKVAKAAKVAPSVGSASPNPSNFSDFSDRPRRISAAATISPGPGADSRIWRDWHAQRRSIRELEGRYSRPVAESLAFGEALERWCALHWRPAVDPDLCSACGRPLSGCKRIALDHGAVVHADADWSCLITYGSRRKSAAVEALAAMGILPPQGWQC